MSWLFKLNAMTNAMQSISDQAVNLINLDIDQTKSLLVTLKKYAGYNGDNYDTTRDLFEIIQLEDQQNTKYLTIAWLDSDGNALASSHPNSTQLSFKKELDEWYHNEDHYVVSDTISEDIIPYIIYIDPFYTPSGSKYYLIAKVSLRGFWDLFNPEEIKGISFGNTGRGVLLNQNFQVIGHSDPAKVYTKEVFPIQHIIDTTKNTQNGTFQDVFFSIRKMQIAPGKYWWLMVTLSKSEVYDSAYRTVGTTLIMLLVVSVIIVYFTTRSAKELSEPIQNICIGTKVIADGDFSHRLIQQTIIQEAIELQDHFNDMASKLQNTIERLTKADRLAALGTMASIVAHEIRNPLSSIVSFSIPLKKRIEENDFEFLNDFDEVVPKELNRLNEILNEFLDFARPQAIEYDEADLNELIIDIVRLIELGLQQNEKIIMDLNPEIPHILIDKKKFRQVIINLCKNGIEACEEVNATVRVSTDYLINEQEEYIIVRVADSGTGIPDSIRKTLFEPFQTTKQKGTGLGLAISQRIIEEHGGSISVESSGKTGTVFKIILNKVK